MVFEDHDFDTFIRTLDLKEMLEDPQKREVVAKAVWTGSLRAVFQGNVKLKRDKHCISLKADAKLVVIPS